MNNELILEGYTNRFNKDAPKRKPISLKIDSLQEGGDISYKPTYDRNFYTKSYISDEYEPTHVSKFSARITNPSLPTRVEIQGITQPEQEVVNQDEEDTFEEWNDIDNVVLFEEDVPDDIKNNYTI